ncbi:MAG TPA: hypothetical protein VGK36_14040 [Candidatus Angelobacter sp.]|jgi:hypothetical protein
MKLLNLAAFLIGALPNVLIAQSDMCWRQPYPTLIGDWSGYGFIVEADNRYQAIRGVTVEEWALPYGYDEALRRQQRGESPQGRLIQKAVSNSQGEFKFSPVRSGKQEQSAGYEYRVYMEGREPVSAFVAKSALAQWVGRGVRIALSYEGKGCSRIYHANLQEIDCGNFDCDRLPRGTLKLVRADGTPVRGKRLRFYLHSKGREPLELVVVTNPLGVVNTKALQQPCYDIKVESEGRMHLCFSGTHALSVPTEVKVILPPPGSPLTRMFP